jgi:hypothetical protein
MSRQENKSHSPVAVAIPARNESAHLATCLHALDSQSASQIDHIVLCINNTTDDTAGIARAVPLRPGTRLHVIECALPDALAHAGLARRLAMESAYALVGDTGILLTTDADGVVDSNWLTANLAALRAGADAVAGWVDLDPESWHRIPMRLHEDDARECAYDALCDEIHALLDPDPADPLPRHTQQSGASIAVTARMYRRCGGLPAVPHGEDRALFAALRRADARIRHAPECHVTVSGRTEGRAAGGMADTIRRRLTAPDTHLDDRLEPAVDCARRARLRRAFRLCLADPSRIARLATETGLPCQLLEQALGSSTFGEAWAWVEAASPVLARHRVPVSDLPTQTQLAQAICDNLRRHTQRPQISAPGTLCDAAD